MSTENCRLGNPGFSYHNNENRRIRWLGHSWHMGLLFTKRRAGKSPHGYRILRANRGYVRRVSPSARAIAVRERRGAESYARGSVRLSRSTGVWRSRRRVARGRSTGGRSRRLQSRRAGMRGAPGEVAVRGDDRRWRTAIIAVPRRAALGAPRRGFARCAPPAHHSISRQSR